MSARSRTVYAVIVNFNGWRDTVECLESVLRSDYDTLRVIVVDNASTDDSVHRLADWAAGHWPYTPSRVTRLSTFSTPPVAKPVDHVVMAAGSATLDEGVALPTLTI